MERPELQPAERRRQRHRQEARQAILSAAEALLVENGYERFSMRRLADRCGYTTPTIYHYFRDKDGLIDALLTERAGDLLNEMRRVPQGDDPLSNWREMTRAFIRFGLENPTHYRLLTTLRGPDREPTKVGEELLELMMKPFSQLQDASLVIPSDSDGARQATWAMAHGLISIQTERPDYEWSSTLIDTAVELLERGLIHPEGARS
jgi:AcrR family transcriptional regulator